MGTATAVIVNGQAFITTGVTAYAEVDDKEVWDAALQNSIETTQLVYIDKTITELQERIENGEALTNGEKSLLIICKEAEKLGATDLAIYG